MILTPPVGKDGIGTDKTGNILATTKKEQIENLSSTGNNKKVLILDHFDEEEIKLRKGVEHFLEQSINKDFFNLGRVKAYHIFTEGVSSIVARIDMEDGASYVFKSGKSYIPGGDERVHIEGKIYDLRRDLGIKTPIVYKEGTIESEGTDIPYIIMEYIEPKKKIDKENMEDSTLYEVGENIAKMNAIHGKGFGRVKKIEGDTLIGAYDTVDELYASYDKHLKVLKERDELGNDEIRKVQKAIETLKQDFKSGTQATVVHDDVWDNFFLTEPITMFDPNPRLDHPLYDISSTEVYIALDDHITKERGKAAMENIYHGYEKQNQKKIDQNLLNACMILRLIQKMRHLSRAKKKEKKVQEVLALLQSIELI